MRWGAAARVPYIYLSHLARARYKRPVGNRQEACLGGGRTREWRGWEAAAAGWRLLPSLALGSPSVPPRDRR